MKYLIMLLSIMQITIFTLFAQEKSEPSRMDKIISEGGKLIRYDDYKLSDIKGSIGTPKLETKIRVINSGSKPYTYFLLLSMEAKYSTKRASISEEELTDILEVYGSLVDASNSETNSSNYAEMKYVTEDGFEVGYYVKKGKSKWFLKLEKYGSGSIFFLKKSEKFKQVLLAAQSKIKELK